MHCTGRNSALLSSWSQNAWNVIYTNMYRSNLHPRTWSNFHFQRSCAAWCSLPKQAPGGWDAVQCSASSLPVRHFWILADKQNLRGAPLEHQGLVPPLSTKGRISSPPGGLSWGHRDTQAALVPICSDSCCVTCCTTSHGLDHIKDEEKEGMNLIASTNIFYPIFKWFWNSWSTLSNWRTFP